jgi:hypothetical protein
MQAVWVLKRINTPKARALLCDLVRNEGESPLGLEASLALRRMEEEGNTPS